MKEQGGLDLFRIAAALLVIAIHTVSPESSGGGGVQLLIDPHTGTACSAVFSYGDGAFCPFLSARQGEKISEKLAESLSRGNAPVSSLKHLRRIFRGLLPLYSAEITAV